MNYPFKEVVLRMDTHGVVSGWNTRQASGPKVCVVFDVKCACLWPEVLDETVLDDDSDSSRRNYPSMVFTIWYHVKSNHTVQWRGRGSFGNRVGHEAGLFFSPPETNSSCKTCCRSLRGVCAPYQDNTGSFQFLRKGKPCTVGFCDGAVRQMIRVNTSNLV